MYFRNIVFAALIVGTLAGLILGAVQTFGVTPTILAAEVYEVAEPVVNALPEHHQQAAVEHNHNDHAQEISTGGHEHSPDTWAPADGAERIFYTFVADILSGIGFALLLISAMAFSGKASTKNSWLWGAAGFITFFVAPGLGLTPEIPGMEAANLQGRQGWWLITVVLTAVGLGLIAFGQLNLKIGGLVLLLLPHILGAPLLEGTHGFNNPDQSAVAALKVLAEQFIHYTAIANAIFWLVLGVASAVVMKQFGLLDDHPN